MPSESSSAQSIFQFTLGPVQGFVSQARRTRDFWAGSFILSWLSGVAMACIKEQGGNIEFPLPDDDYLKWLTTGTGEKRPQQGSIPNRFKAVQATVPRDFHPEWVSEAVRGAWRALAEAVWQGDLEGRVGDATRVIWERQINQFWELSWVLSEQEEGNLLDRRKNWRSSVAPAEPGHKCMMMDGWQELSGVLKTNMGDVNAFWKKLRASGKKGMQTDLRDSEHLCALAFVKRRFARYFESVNYAMPDGKTRIFGWKVPSSVPSTSFLAAAPWIAEAIEKAPHAFAAFHAEAQKLSSYSEADHIGGESEFEVDISCVSKAANAQAANQFRRLWAGLDGQLYFPTVLQNAKQYPDQQQANRVVRALNALKDAAGITHLPAPYYAILLMDGDQLGKHMGDKEKQAPISEALNAFTKNAGKIVRDHNGFLIYAGGDDVLALFPLEHALSGAAALQKDYRAMFKEHTKGKVDSTLSGAIEYVHIRTPLTIALKDSHKLLDDIAKDKTGRNAIAIRVQKPSGLAAEWSMPWEKALVDYENGHTLHLEELAKTFAAQSEEDGAFSNKFFFRAKQLIESYPKMEQAALEKLLLAEYLHSFGRSSKTLSDGEQKALEKLRDQCQNWQRPEAGKAAEINKKEPFNPDAALVVRFLAQKGMEKESA